MDFSRFTSEELAEARSYLEQENAQWPEQLKLVDPATWPHWKLSVPPVRVYRSRRFLMLEFGAEHGVVRLSVIRNVLAVDGARWGDRITWDELQQLKAEAGYADHDAVEVYPRQRDVVNVANMRHLWVSVHETLPMPFVWRRDLGR